MHSLEFFSVNWVESVEIFILSVNFILEKARFYIIFNNPRHSDYPAFGQSTYLTFFKSF